MGAASRDLRIAGWALLGLLLWEAAALDLPLARQFGTAAGFAWRDAWLTRSLLHEGGRALAGVLLALLAVDAWRPVLLGPSRRQRLFWLLVVLAAMLLLPLIKQHSASSCPWALSQFGGQAAYVPHWLPGVFDGGPGHCFPSGHAVSGFAFIGLYFLRRPHRPRLARTLLAMALLLGILAGAVQMLRGAHFASHVLWTGWLCWLLCSLAAVRVRGRSAARLEPQGLPALDA